MAMTPPKGIKRKFSNGSQASTPIDHEHKTKKPTSKRNLNGAEDDPPTARHAATTIMDLPKEILVQIIGHALINPNPITLRKPHEYRWAKELDSLRDNSTPRNMKRRRTRKSPLLRMLLVCRDFYFAGLEAYYGGNTFHFDTPLDFRDTFVTTLSERHKACIKRLVVDWDSWYPVHTARPEKDVTYYSQWQRKVQDDLLESFPKLESVIVNCSMNREPMWLGAASRAAVAKALIQEQVLELWPSNASKIKCVFPRGWGRLANI